MDISFDKTINCFKFGQESGVFPGGIISIGNKNGVLRREFVGYRSVYPTEKKVNMDTIFDIASMSKIVSTTMVTLKLLELDIIRLDDKIDNFFDVKEDKKNITIKNLLTHTSGLNASFNLSKVSSSYDDGIKAILDSKLECNPGEKVIYSCMGYILLGNILEKVSGKSLDKLSREIVFGPLEMKNTRYGVIEDDNVASTEYDKANKRYLKGIVHDENSRFLNGISGNAGVFSTIKDLENFALMLLNKGKFNGKDIIGEEILEESIKNQTENLDEGRGLGFLINDGTEVLPAGVEFSRNSYGHTGYTGTSLWIEKELGIYIIMLTNRVHPTRENTNIIKFRRVINEILINEIKEKGRENNEQKS